MWHALRVGRITSTKCHAILTRRQTTSPASIIKTVMGYTTIPVSKEMALGLQNEESIRQKYISLMSSGTESVDLDDDTDSTSTSSTLEPDYINRHQSFTCIKSGLQTHSEYNFLAATPDGMTSCLCCGSGTLEVKTIAKYFDTGLPNPLPSDMYLDETFQLKTSHAYYTQVQFQLLVTKTDFCDFVCATAKEIIIQIRRDNNFIDILRDLCVSFFKAFILKELLTHKLDPSYRNLT
jgi:hypothetical protein